LGNNQDNFQLHRFTTSKNIAKIFFFGGGATFFTHTVYHHSLRRIRPHRWRYSSQSGQLKGDRLTENKMFSYFGGQRHD